MQQRNSVNSVSRGFRAAVLAVSLVASLSVSGVAQACLNAVVSQETLALSVRTLQSDLMVAALSCNERDRYNAFAVNFRTPLKKHGTTLKSYFNSLHGAASTKKLNAYVTDLANFAAVRHAQDRKEFCGGTESAFRALLIDKTSDIQAVALAYALRVSPSLNHEIKLAALDGGCTLVSEGATVVAGGQTVLY